MDSDTAMRLVKMIGDGQVRLVRPEGHELLQGHVVSIIRTQHAIRVHLSWVAKRLPEGKWVLRPGPYVLTQHLMPTDEAPIQGDEGSLTLGCNGQGLLKKAIFFPHGHPDCLDPKMLEDEPKPPVFEMNL